MLIYPVTKKCEFTVPVAKTLTLLAAICAHLAQGANILTRKIWLWPTSCKILSGSVNVCQSYSPYYSKHVYWICLCSNVSWFIRRQKYKTIADFEQIYRPMHDSVGVQLGTSLQSAKSQLANLLQNCYFCLIQKTISNWILWSLVIKYFGQAVLRPLTCCARGQLPPSAPPSVTPLKFCRKITKSTSCLDHLLPQS